MKLFLLELKDKYVVWDSYVSHVVLAPDEPTARHIANEVVGPSEKTNWHSRPGDEGYVWEDNTRTTCTEIDTNGHQGLISSGFNAG